MATLHELSTAQLRQALQLREQIESLQQKLDALLGNTGGVAPSKAKSSPGRTRRKRIVSAEARAKMAAAQQARWAKIKGKSLPAKAAKKAAPKTKGSMSPEAKAKIGAAMKARWAAKKKGVSTQNSSAA